jgi:hypothetical protein
MPNQPQEQPEQELSIKQRSHALFLQQDPDEGMLASKPFAVHLRETEAVPLSALTKSILWCVGIIVGLLFLAAIWRIVQRHNSAPRPAAKATVSGAVSRPALESTVAGIAYAGLSAGHSKWEDGEILTVVGR